MFRLLALFPLGLAASASAQTVEPPASGGLPVVAVPPLPTPKVTQTEAGQTHAIGLQVAEVIAADLRTSGVAAPIGPKNVRVYSYPEVTGPLFQQWRSVGAKALVTGFVQARADGRLTIGCYLYDISERRELARKGFVVPVTGWRRAAHRCADTVYKGLTGKAGMFDSTVVYVAESGSPEARQKRIAMMDGDGSNHRFLTAGNTTVLTPRLSPDGGQIAYTALEDGVPRVRVIDVENGSDRPLLPQGITFSPRFSPDGRRLLLSMAVNGNTDLYLIDTEGGPPQRLTSTPGADTAGSFSPDGARIVFESDRSGSPQLYLMNIDGSAQRRISFGTGRYGTPAWSPAGDLIAFSRSSGIGVMTSEGTDERMLTSGGYDEAPSWAANGQLLLFQRTDPRSRRSSLMTIGLGGDEPRVRVTPQDGSDPHWSQVQE